MSRARVKSETSFGPTVINAKRTAKPIVPTRTTYSVVTAPLRSRMSDARSDSRGGVRMPLLISESRTERDTPQN